MSVRHPVASRGLPTPQPAASTHAPAPTPGTSFFSSATTRTASSKKLIGDYLLGKTLGAGSMGKVKLATNQRTGLKVACKIIPRAHSDSNPDADPRTIPDADNKEVRVVREAAILQLLRHPNVVRLYDTVIERRHFYLFFEYVSGGQMLDYIISHGRLKERVARKFMRQMVSAVDYCHRNSVIHRDLKIENVLLTDTGRIKLIDFGLSNLYSPRSLLRTFCGSLYFAAPELLNARPYVGPEVDIWSLGVILFVLVCGKVPFDDQSMPVLHAKIKRGLVDYPSHLSSECKHLMQRMLAVDPRSRATMADVRMHPFLNKGHSHPPITHLPPRKPLHLPLNPEVIRRMTGFQFGTEREIRQHLEGVVAAWEERRRLASLMKESGFDGKPSTVEAKVQQENPENGAEAQQKVTDDGTAVSSAGNQPSASAAEVPPTTEKPDPNQQEVDFEDEIANGGLQRDPMVSIYYLVREKMEREARGEEEAAEEYWEREKARERERELRKQERLNALAALKGTKLQRAAMRGSAQGQDASASTSTKRSTANTTATTSPRQSTEESDHKPGFFRRRTTISTSGPEPSHEGTISKLRRAMTDRKSTAVSSPGSPGVDSNSEADPKHHDGPGVLRRLSRAIKTGTESAKSGKHSRAADAESAAGGSMRKRASTGVPTTMTTWMETEPAAAPADAAQAANQESLSTAPLVKQPSEDASLMARLRTAELNARVAATDNELGNELKRQSSRPSSTSKPDVSNQGSSAPDDHVEAVQRYAAMLANPAAFQASPAESSRRASLPVTSSPAHTDTERGPLSRIARRVSSVRKNGTASVPITPATTPSERYQQNDSWPLIDTVREESTEEPRPRSRHGTASRVERSKTSPAMISRKIPASHASKTLDVPGSMEYRVNKKVQSRRTGLAHRVSGLWNRALDRGGSVRDDRRRSISDLAELDERPSATATTDSTRHRPSSFQPQVRHSSVPTAPTAPAAAPNASIQYPPPARNPNLLTVPTATDQHASSDVESAKDQASSAEDLLVKKVYLKGLFSVASTSTRSAPEVRARLIRAFENANLAWRELPRVRFQVRYQYVFGADSSERLTVEDEERWRREVQFEVSVVKVPWLFGVHGVRFHRTSGDAWRYKECCERILARAKL